MPELLPTLVEPLNRAGWPYMVTGSMAVIAYGEPRLTLDIDLVLAIPAAALALLPALFPAPEFYCPPVEVLQVECSRGQRGHFNLLQVASGLKADVYPAGSDPLHRWGLEHRRRITVEGLSVAFAPPEYVIVRKLEYHREGGSEKHLRDIRSMLEVCGGSLDRGWLDRAIRDRGLGEFWEGLVARG